MSVADDALAEVGDELGALVKKIVPGVRVATSVAPEQQLVSESQSHVPEHADFIISPQHDDNDAAYHETLREHMTALCGSLCDESLADVLKIARDESARRAEGRN